MVCKTIKLTVKANQPSNLLGKEWNTDIYGDISLTES